MQPAVIETWFRDEAEEEGMFEDHAYLWRHLIATVPGKDLTGHTILDYGCNRGGFLRLLYEERPFTRGIGVDVAAKSLELARERSAGLPFEFFSPAGLEKFAGSVDIAFSHEVLYLLPDLAAHATAIARVLRGKGAYYAAIGCHTGNPLWDRWRELIAEGSNLPVFDYSLDDYARAFRRAGFRVEMRPFQLRDFVLIKPDNEWFPAAADSLDYHTRVKTIIRATKTG